MGYVYGVICPAIFQILQNECGSGYLIDQPLESNDLFFLFLSIVIFHLCLILNSYAAFKWFSSLPSSFFSTAHLPDYLFTNLLLSASTSEAD